MFGKPETPSIGSLMMYECFIGIRGIGKPAISETFPAHAPVNDQGVLRIQD